MSQVRLLLSRECAPDASVSPPSSSESPDRSFEISDSLADVPPPIPLGLQGRRKLPTSASPGLRLPGWTEDIYLITLESDASLPEAVYDLLPTERGFISIEMATRSSPQRITGPILLSGQAQEIRTGWRRVSCDTARVWSRSMGIGVPEERPRGRVDIHNLLEACVSATAPTCASPADTALTMIVDLLCEAARHDYEAGAESGFSRRFSALVTAMGRPAVQAIAHIMDGSLAPRDMLSEALVWLGDLRDASTQTARRALLTEALRKNDLYIRGGAITGLCLLGDAVALPDLRRALVNERVPEFKEQIQIAIRHLESLENGMARSVA